MSKYLDTHETLQEAIIAALMRGRFREFTAHTYDPASWMSAAVCMRSAVYADYNTCAPKEGVYAIIHKYDAGICVTLEYRTMPDVGFCDDQFCVPSVFSMDKFFPLETPDVIEDDYCRPSEYAFVSVDTMLEWMLDAFVARCIAIDALDEGETLSISHPLKPCHPMRPEELPW